jgi:hypothetical protein
MRASDDEPTLAICIRCGQSFVARSSCPYCEDLVIRIRETGDAGGWMFQVSQRSTGAAIVEVEGFASSAAAQGPAHEFVRRLVNEMVDRKGRGCTPARSKR